MFAKHPACKTLLGIALLKQSLHIMCILNIRVARFPCRNCSPKRFPTAIYFLKKNLTTGKHWPDLAPTNAFFNVRNFVPTTQIRRDLLYVWTVGSYNCTAELLKNKWKSKNNPRVITNHHFVKHRSANITRDNVNTKPYLRIVFIFNIRIPRVSERNCRPKRMSNTQLPISNMLTQPTAMGPIMLPLDCYINISRECCPGPKTQ